MAGASVRWGSLVALLLFVGLNTLNQWDRYLLNYLSSFTFEACADICKDSTTHDFCTPCPINSTACEQCQTCLTSRHIEKFNIRDATCLSLVEYGVLTGFGFTVLYVACTLLSGRLADRYNRRNTLAVGGFIWSVATASQSLATSFWTLFACRLCLGVGEAFAAPQVYSMLVDLFPLEQRGKAASVFALGIYLGGGLASTSLLITRELGWRGTSVMLGCLGLGLVGALLCFVREPTRGAMITRDRRSILSAVDGGIADGFDGDDLEGEDLDDDPSNTAITGRRKSMTISKPGPRQGGNRGVSNSFPIRPAEGHGLSFVDTLKLTISTRALQWLYIGASIRFFGGYTIAAFAPLFFQTYFGDHESAYAVTNAVCVLVGGCISSFAGGWISDRLSLRSHKGPLLVMACGALTAVPAMLAVVVLPSFPLSMAAYFLEYLLAESWIGPAYSVVQRAVPQHAVGVASSVFICMTMLVGSAAPPILAAIIQAVDGENTLRWSLFGGVAASYCLAAAAFLICSAYLGYVARRFSAIVP